MLVFSVTERIPRIDLSNLKPIALENEYRKWPRMLGAVIGVGFINEKSFIWIPSLIKEVKRVYQKPWKDVVMTDLRNIHPLTAPAKTIQLRNKLWLEFQAARDEIIEAFWKKKFENFFSFDEFNKIIQLAMGEAEIRSVFSLIWDLAEGQTKSLSTKGWRIVLFLMGQFCGMHHEARDASTVFIPEKMHPVFFAAVRGRHLQRLKLQGVDSGFCRICWLNGNQSEEFGKDDYINHVMKMHPFMTFNDAWYWRTSGNQRAYMHQHSY